MSTPKLGSTNTSHLPQAHAEATTKQQTELLNGEYSAGFQAQGLGSYKTENAKFAKQKLTISFCPKCKMLLRSVESSPSSLRCKRCGYHLKLGEHVVYGGKAVGANQRANEIAVIDQDKSRSLHTFPIVQATCDRCGKTESETWTIAVGSEGTTSAVVFLKCTHCGFTRREVG